MSLISLTLFLHSIAVKFINFLKCPYVSSILENKEFYLLGAMSEEGYVLDEPPMCIYKENGRMETYFPPDHVEEFLSLKETDVPEKYRFKGERKSDEI